MSLQPELFSLLFATAIGIALVTAAQAWKIRDEPGGLGLVASLFGIALWAVCVFVMTLVPGRELLFVFLKLRMLGVCVTIAGMFVTVVGYLGYGKYITRRTVGLLAIEPIVVNLVLWIRPNLIWSTIEFDPTAGMGVELTYGIVFVIHVIYSYLLVLMSVSLLLRFSITSKQVFRKQIAATVTAIIAPFLTNMVYLSGLISYDVTVVGFVVTGISLSGVLQRGRFFDLKPIARNRVVETLTSGVFVIDTQTRLVDCNERGMELLGISASDIGRPADELLDASPEAAALFSEIADSTEQHSIQTEIDNRHYEIELTPIHDERETLVGRVLLVHDITDSKHQQARLARQNERLNQFASVVSHDLRNPLTVASGYLELARESGESEHFERVETSHRRMEEMIDEFLTFARLDDSEFETTSVDLESCVSTAWEHVQTADAGLAADCEPQIEANREYLLQLLENLIRNSVEHGGPAVTITVTVEEPNGSGPSQLDTTTRLVVSDDGTGIPPEERDLVFKQGHTTGDGVGLGLAIVSQIAEVHDWSVDVAESEAGGAAFVFNGVEVAGGDEIDPSTSTAA